MECRDTRQRDLLRLAFSATLVRINRTFLSAKNRRESRGGSAVFSIYRYKVAKRPVELPLWTQFATRVERLLEAKRETNELIGDYYRDDVTALFRHASATRLLDFLKPRSVDYIYTDPPYGGHIAYLDLTTMWSAWLGLDITPDDRAQEVIEGGELRKTRGDYQALLAQSLAQMHEVLKPGAWMSIVFAHRDTTYWDALVDACAAAGFQYANTVVQPVGVVWSMHKKKNPLRVLSGELVLNFRNSPSTVVAVKRAPDQGEPVQIVRETCEAEIIRSLGATTEELHHAVVPRLLGAGLLRAFSKEHGDLVGVLESHFVFEPASGKWHIADGTVRGRFVTRDIARYHVARLLALRRDEARPVNEAEVCRQVHLALRLNGSLDDKAIAQLLREVGVCPDGSHWLPRTEGVQAQLF